MDDRLLLTSKVKLLQFLEIKENFLYDNFSKKYHEKDEPKRSGGTRKIRSPSKRLKAVQRVVLDKFLLPNTQLLPCVYGASKDRDLKRHVLLHQKNAESFVLLLDIKDFFGSISDKMVRNIFKRVGFSSENAAILTKICTVDYELPQGAPSSPYLSCLACQALDKKIYNHCRRHNLIYSRYFDDICISGEGLRDHDMAKIRKIITVAGFSAHKQNLQKPFEKKTINSVVLRPRDLSVTDKYKLSIASLYTSYKKNKNDSTKKIYEGKIGFYRYINREESDLFEETLR